MGLEILRFFESIEKIKRKEREGWRQQKVKGVVETIGSHSLGAALLGWYLAKSERNDEVKIIKMLILHDLVMAYIPDFIPAQKEYARKKEIENTAIEKLLEDVPENMKEEIKNLIIEYQEQKTPDSQLAREADKLDTLLQSLSYAKENNRKEIFEEFLKNYESFSKSETGKKIIEKLKFI